MPVLTTYPGVYIEEIPSGVHTITGVATSITAFVGYTQRGLDNRAKRILSFADFQRAFGGLAAESELSYAVQQFFTNGGTTAYVVRVPKASNVPSGETAAAAASVTLEDAASGSAKVALTITAVSKGAWGNHIIADVDYNGIDHTTGDPLEFNLTITDLETGVVESFPKVTLNNARANFVEPVVNDLDNGSKLVSVAVPSPSTAGVPVETGTVGGDIDLTQIKSNKDYSLTISSDLPANKISSVPIPFINTGDPIPGSTLGVCRLLEKAANIALQNTLPGAAIRCVPSSSGKGVRVLADFADELNARDAKITFGTGSPNDIGATLGLSSGATANVAHYVLGGQSKLAQKVGDTGADGTVLPGANDLIGDPGTFTGIYALDKVDLFNILCIPDATRAQPGDPTKSALPESDRNAVFSAAMTFCSNGRRAFVLIDPPPEVDDVDSATDWKSAHIGVHDKNGAAYFPRIRLSDPLNNFQLRTFAPCGVVAGLYARIDANRGVWKAPAGTEATLSGVQGLVYNLTDAENGVLNPLGLNCLRIFPVYGAISWGARTLVGADADTSEWKYIPVRRMALFLEETLYRNTKWVVFEPNDEPLWSQIRLNIGAFMQDLFRQGAFQGQKPSDAYFVKCDKETTTQNDIDKGIVNIIVGFAPLKPAEFVIIKIQQIAGQIAT